MRPRQDGRYFPDDCFKCISWIFIRTSLKFVPECPINNEWALLRVLDWRRTGDKPLPEPCWPSSLTHICGARGNWFNRIRCHGFAGAANPLTMFPWLKYVPGDLFSYKRLLNSVHRLREEYRKIIEEHRYDYSWHIIVISFLWYTFMPWPAGFSCGCND